MPLECIYAVVMTGLMLHGYNKNESNLECVSKLHAWCFKNLDILLTYVAYKL